MPSLPRKPPIAILVAVSAVGPLALNIFMPSMPGLPAIFDTDYATVQLTLSLFLIGLAVAQLAYGPLSDRFGRRPPLLVGMLLFILGSAVGLLATSIATVIVGRIIQAIGGCAGLVLARAIVRDLYDRNRSASVIAYITMAMVVVPMLAPLIGGFLDDWFGWRSNFWFVGGFAAVVTAFALLLLHESNHRRTSLPGIGGMIVSYRRLLRSPVFRGYAFMTTFSSAGFFAFLGGAPYVMIELMGRSPSEYGLYFIMSAVGYMAGNFMSGRGSVRLGIDRMIGMGVGFSLLGGLTMLALALVGFMTPMALFGPMVLYAIGNGLTIPNGIAGAISVHPRIAGAASGLAGFLQMAIGAGASALVGHLVAESQLPLAVMIFSAALCAMFAHLFTLLANRRTALA
ncbi:MAG: multidrug effflux MFS transporter [Alphaproteobacteria bacterium]